MLLEDVNRLGSVKKMYIFKLCNNECITVNFSGAAESADSELTPRDNVVRIAPIQINSRCWLELVYFKGQLSSSAGFD